MDYKQRIINMLDRINNDTFIEMIYGFVRRLYWESGDKKD